MCRNYILCHQISFIHKQMSIINCLSIYIVSQVSHNKETRKASHIRWILDGV
ncbi:conserved domain protein [Prevotella denticola CRIS 18C-A]|uniref:Conserved domain protein n=1 Tax=Prevotella denticola CRIS 18C-A TaxID=944557 RepID=F0H568_9BACT|nr:conserved domain protein [Prevotella denticola CRIS 18C-A]